MMGCVAGQGEEGSEFLKKLSTIWPGRKVVWFATVGYSHGSFQYSKGMDCNEPGMRDTIHVSPAPDDSKIKKIREDEYERKWPNLTDFPWCSEFSPRVKTALNGKLVRDNTSK
jgi:hypothetical protein